LKKDDEAGSRNHRAAETKHGRVAMMTELGGVAQHYIKFPGFDDGPVGRSAMSSPGSYGLVALSFSGVMKPAIWQQDAEKDAVNLAIQ
jgi:hypothetical protein